MCLAQTTRVYCLMKKADSINLFPFTNLFFFSLGLSSIVRDANGKREIGVAFTGISSRGGLRSSIIPCNTPFAIYSGVVFPPSFVEQNPGHYRYSAKFIGNLLVDASDYRNFTAFFNHACPRSRLLNSKIELWTCECFAYLVFFSTRNIQLNEEIYFSYCNDKHSFLKWGFTCRCGSSKCYSSTA